MENLGTTDVFFLSESLYTSTYVPMGSLIPTIVSLSAVVVTAAYSSEFNEWLKHRTIVSYFRIVYF